MSDARPLSRRFRDAMVFAAEAHEGQARKGTDTPYIAHLLGVTAIVLEHGGDEDQAIAALLHDAVEDCGGAPMREQIRERFGGRVTRMVDDCTDADTEPKPPWRERKLAYLAHLPEAHPDSLLVSMADKLYNAGAILRDLRHLGTEVFDRFTAGQAEKIWYYESLVTAFEAHAPEGRAGDLLDDLRAVVRELARTAAALGLDTGATAPDDE